MTAHTITDPPHRLADGEKYTAWIKTVDGFFVQLHIAGIATQEQADKFVRETAAAPELLKVCSNILHWAKFDERGLRDDLEGDLEAAIAKATGTAP